MMDRGVGCELCGTPTVYQVGEDPPGIGHWRCTQCGDFKRWCEECNQGWIRRFRIPYADHEVYSCDECEAAWPSVRAIQARGISRSELLSQLGTVDTWAQLELAREQMRAPPHNP